MAKLRRALTWSPIRIEISSDSLARLQQVGKCKLYDGDAKELENIVNGYICRADLEERWANSKHTESYLKTLQTNTKTLIKEIEDVFFEDIMLGLSNNRFTAKFTVLHEVFVDRKSNLEFLSQLHSFNSACEKARKALQDAKFSSSQGRRQADRFIRLFNDVGRIYEDAGGTPTAYWSDHDRDNEPAEQEGSAFTDFVHELLALCPTDHQPTSKKALAARIRRWRKDRPAAQKRSAD